jgi:hypothetical protein
VFDLEGLFSFAASVASLCSGRSCLSLQVFIVAVLLCQPLEVFAVESLLFQGFVPPRANAFGSLVGQEGCRVVNSGVQGIVVGGGCSFDFSL